MKPYGRVMLLKQLQRRQAQLKALKQHIQN